MKWLPGRNQRLLADNQKLLANATSLLIAGVLAGVVVAAAAFPAVAITGLAAKSGADAFENLPSQLKTPPAPQITYVYASDGKTLLTMLYDENRRDIPISQVGTLMQQAIVAAEDARFYQHHGVDPKGVLRAFIANNQANGVSQGASTLTMQYVRQALKYNATTPEEVIAATEETPARKLREMRYAVALEKRLSKKQILERYLNISYFGHRAYGIHAAAQVYFNTTPDKLTLAQAALLAGLVKSPSDYDPTTPDGAKQAQARRAYVLDQMVRAKDITQAEADAANRTPVLVKAHDLPGGCISTRPNSAGFFCDYLVNWWSQQTAFGADPEERVDRLKRGGYTIVSSLDVGLQAKAEKNIPLADNNPDAINMVAVEPGTGRIRAMAVNRLYSLDQSHNGPSTDPAKAGQRGTYPATTNPLLSGGGDIVGYQAGSTFKIFTVVAALQAGYPLAYTIHTTSPYVSKYWAGDKKGDAGCAYDAAAQAWHYCPTNDNPSWMNGTRSMWTGFGRSVNTYFVPLEERVGADNAVAAAKALGIQFRAKGGPGHAGDYEISQSADMSASWGAFTLGVSATTPLDLANAYATLANDGTYCAPLPVNQVKDLAGRTVDVAQPNCHQAVTPDVARGAMDVARCPVGDQTVYKKCDGGTVTAAHDTVGHPLAGKTGTTDHTTATLVLTTKQLAIAGIAADPDYPVADASNLHWAVNSAVIDTMADGMAGKPQIDFVPPSQHIAYGDQRPVPDVTCQSPDSAQAELRAAGFRAEIASDPITSDCPEGTVADTSPSGMAPKGSTITLYLSKGRSAPSSTPTTGRGKRKPSATPTLPGGFPSPPGGG